MERPPCPSGVHPTNRERCTPSPGKAHCGEWLPNTLPWCQCGTVGVTGRDTPTQQRGRTAGEPHQAHPGL